MTDTLGFSELSDGEYRLDGETRHFHWGYDATSGRGMPGAGTVHHIAWHSRDEEHVAWQERVAEAGMHVTPVIDRDYFLSIYFRQPQGVLFEIATTSPGFAVDEDPEHLGEELRLPSSTSTCGRCWSATSRPSPTRVPRRATRSRTMGLTYRERPAAGEPAGLLILHHGRGADELDLLGLADVLDPQRRLHVVTPRGPLTLPGWPGFHWYTVPRVGYPDRDTFRRAYAELAGFHDATWARTGVAPEQTVLGGFSMGSVMSYALGLSGDRPEPAGILAISGFIPTVEGWQPDLASRPALPVFITHGRQDPIIDVGSPGRPASGSRPRACRSPISNRTWRTR